MGIPDFHTQEIYGKTDWGVFLLHLWRFFGGTFSYYHLWHGQQNYSYEMTAINIKIMMGFIIWPRIGKRVRPRNLNSFQMKKITTSQLVNVLELGAQTCREHSIQEGPEKEMPESRGIGKGLLDGSEHVGKKSQLPWFITS